MLITFRVFVGVGEASYATISPSLISDSYTPAKRNNALTLFYVAIPVGAALGTIIGGVIAAKWGWRHAFIWAGVPGLLLALVLLPFTDPKRGQADGRTADAGKRPSVRDLLNLFRIQNICSWCWATPLMARIENKWWCWPASPARLTGFIVLRRTSGPAARGNPPCRCRAAEFPSPL